jgi:hypothetical protein
MVRLGEIHERNYSRLSVDPSIKLINVNFREALMSKANQWLKGGIFILLLSAMGALHAQNVTSCPPGMVPYGAGVCGYDQSQSQGAQQQIPAAPPPKWADKWGAIALYLPQGGANPKGVLGAATLQPSDSAAKQVALLDCQAKGGLDCRIKAVYRNECAALVAGNPDYNIADGVTTAAAVAKGMKICTDGGNTGCHVYYYACSLPQVVQ